MDLIRRKIFRGKCISIIVLLHFNIVFAQNNLDGNWKPQQNDYTCWAASLANLTNIKWTNYRLYEEKIDPDFVPASLEYFGEITKPLFKFRGVTKDTVLSFEAINQYLSYDFPRPLIYSYNYEYNKRTNIGGGHFVNIIGCLKSNNLDDKNNKWLKIFDPKPNNIGTYYLKNYECYQVINSLSATLQGTFFNFVRVKDLPSLRDNDRKKGIESTKYDCNNCISNLKKSQKNIKPILEDTLFTSYVGKNISFPKKWYIEITKIEDIVNSRMNAFQTIEKKEGAILIINYDENKALKGGTTLKYMAYSNKYLIDRIEDISKYDNLKKYFQRKDATIVVTKDEYRFIRFKENNSIKYVDIDTLLSSGKSNIYPDSVFKQKIIPHYIKISESGKMILKSCQKILDLKEPSLNVGEGRFFLPASIKYSEFFEGSSNFPDSLTYMLSKDIGSSDAGLNYFTLFFHSSDILRTRFETHVPPKFRPNKIYSFSDSIFNEGQLIFIPISEKSKIRYPETMESLSELSKYAVKIENIARISEGRIENMKGFMNTKQPEYFQNKKFSNGIICDLLMKDGRIIPCYLVTRQESDSVNRIQWKK